MMIDFSAYINYLFKPLLTINCRLIFLIFLLSTYNYAQTIKIEPLSTESMIVDSLERMLPKTKEDTFKVKLLA